jgi:ubiquinone/menaquinone biosynthesis C-methylase UbiE
MYNRHYAERYNINSFRQDNAADRLIRLANIKRNDTIIDIGCGSGGMIKKLRRHTNQLIVGIDSSQDMIRLAKIRATKQRNVEFRCEAIERLSAKGQFNLAISNSAFHWFNNHDEAIKNIYRALKNNGRFIMQVPGKKSWCPQITDVLESVQKLPDMRQIAKHYKSPWTYYEKEEAYISLFESIGFIVEHCKLKKFTFDANFEQIIKIFHSGSSAAYFNKRNYNCSVNNCYFQLFEQHFMNKVKATLTNNNKQLTFYRLFLLARKNR